MTIWLCGSAPGVCGAVLSGFSRWVAEAGNGVEAVALAGQHQPDVILMDIRMPVLDGLAATRRIRDELQLPVKIITYTSYTWPELEREARDAGLAIICANRSIWMC